MSASNREASISKTLQYEGGYTNDPRDPGGATNWGITIYDARLHWKPDATPADVRAMPKSVAIDIYRQKYWAKMDCDNRPTGPDFVDFDLGVNSGVGKVFAWRPLFAKLDPVSYVKALCAKRLSFLHALRTWSAFGRGWGRRVADVEATGVRMALGASGQPVQPTLQKHAAAAKKKATGHATAGATTAAGASHGWLSAWHHVDPSTKAGLVFLALAGVAVVAGFVWHAVHNAHRVVAYTQAATPPAAPAAPAAPAKAPAK
jgi:lysozyme family protein